MVSKECKSLNVNSYYSQGLQWTTGLLVDNGKLVAVLECVPKMGGGRAGFGGSYDVYRFLYGPDQRFQVKHYKGSGHCLGAVAGKGDLLLESAVDRTLFNDWMKMFPNCRVPFRVRVAFKDLLGKASSSRFLYSGLAV